MEGRINDCFNNSKNSLLSSRIILCLNVLFFFFFKNTKYFNTHTGRGKNVLKKLIVMLLVYIQKGHYYFLFALMGIKFLIEFKQSFENQSKLTMFKHAHFNTIL